MFLWSLTLSFFWFSCLYDWKNLLYYLFVSVSKYELNPLFFCRVHKILRLIKSGGSIFCYKLSRRNCFTRRFQNHQAMYYYFGLMLRTEGIKPQVFALQYLENNKHVEQQYRTKLHRIMLWIICTFHILLNDSIKEVLGRLLKLPF